MTSQAEFILLCLVEIYYQNKMRDFEIISEVKKD